MMNKIVKLRHLAIILSVVIIAIGMAVGTVCHFVAGGFFNYGDEFASYTSIEVTTSVPEDIFGDTVREVVSDEISSLGAYEVSFSEGAGYVPNTVICKFYTSAPADEIASAVSSIEARLEAAGMEDATVGSFVNEGVADGRHQLMFAAIALASAVAFQTIYFALRFRPGMALSSLCNQLVAVGLFASLLAITRCPVGLEAIAFAALTVVLTMICNAIFFDKVKKSFKDEANAKADRLDLIADGARTTAKLNAFVFTAAAITAVIVAIFAIIASPAAITLAPFAVCLLSIIPCAFACAVFSPASYALIGVIDRRKK